MRRSSSFLIVLAAAAITAGTLYAMAGPRYMGRYGANRWHRGYCRWDDSDSGRRGATTHIPPQASDSAGRY